MTDNGETWTSADNASGEQWITEPLEFHGPYFEVHWWQQARKAFHFLLAVVGWASLLALLWAVLLGWLPQSGWIAKVIAGLVFALAGLVGVSSK